MEPVLQPATIQKIGTLLAIAWSDGVETFLPLDFLRRHCPCAACGGEPDVMGNVERPAVTWNQGAFELTSWELVGGYAIQPRWGDGHSTGIFSYRYLRQLARFAP